MNADIAEPAPVAEAAMQGVVDKLREVRFDEEHCTERLGKVEGFPNLAGVAVPRPYLRKSSDSLDAAIALFLLNEELPEERLRELFSVKEIAALQAMHVLDGERAVCRFNLLPCSGNYFVTDRFPLPSEDRPSINRVMWLYGESYILAGLVDRTRRVRSTLDLGTGSGIQALMAVRHSDSVVGVDINPRAIAFSRFNQRLNSCRNAEFIAGDLYAPVAGRRFDLILANPPYNPTLATPAGSDYWSGGPLGDEILLNILSGIDTHLDAHGICHIITLLCHQKSGATWSEKIDRSLGGGTRNYDVLVQVVDANWYIPQARTDRHDFLKKYFSHFDFGVISLRRAAEGDGCYYHGPPFSSPSHQASRSRFIPSVTHATFDLYRNRTRPSVTASLR